MTSSDQTLLGLQQQVSELQLRVSRLTGILVMASGYMLGGRSSQYTGRYEPQPLGGILVYLRFASKSSAKRIAIYARYVLKTVSSIWNGWPHAVTSGILQTCARNIRSGERLPRQIFWVRLRPCKESHRALALYCAQD